MWDCLPPPVRSSSRLQSCSVTLLFVCLLCVTKPSEARADGSLSSCSHAAIVVAYINQAIRQPHIADLKCVMFAFKVDGMLVSVSENKTYCDSQSKGVDEEETHEYADHSQPTSGLRAVTTHHGLSQQLLHDAGVSKVV